MKKQTPCDHCPWRTSNHGKKTPWGFYTKANLKRLWKQLCSGGAPQSCHPTDPSHADHIAAGAKPGSTLRECPGSVILVLREMKMIEEIGGGEINPKAIDAYCKQRKNGLTKRGGVVYWIIQRYLFGKVPLMGGPPLPLVDVADADVSLPSHLQAERIGVQ